MALVMNTIFSGISVLGAYARIEDFNGTKSGMDIQLVYYVSQQACIDGEGSFKREQYSFTPDVSDNAPNYHKQAYGHLKTLPEFTGAVDV